MLLVDSVRGLMPLMLLLTPSPAAAAAPAPAPPPGLEGAVTNSVADAVTDAVTDASNGMSLGAALAPALALTLAETPWPPETRGLLGMGGVLEGWGTGGEVVGREGDCCSAAGASGLAVKSALAAVGYRGATACARAEDRHPCVSCCRLQVSPLQYVFKVLLPSLGGGPVRPRG